MRNTVVGPKLPIEGLGGEYARLADQRGSREPSQPCQTFAKTVASKRPWSHPRRAVEAKIRHDCRGSGLAKNSCVYVHRTKTFTMKQPRFNDSHFQPFSFCPENVCLLIVHDVYLVLSTLRMSPCFS